MNEGRTHITVVLDRSGSMQSIRDDIIGGFNVFLEQQRKEPGAATLTLVQFDTEDSYEVVHSFKPIREVPELTDATYVPRAGTPLIDAMGRTMNNLAAWLAEQKGDGRPSKIVVVFITDGQENSSREFRVEEVSALMDQHKRDGWQFIFLSADLAAINEAGRLGIAFKQSLAFDKNGHGTRSALFSMSEKIRDYRVCNAPPEFSAADRAQQKSESKRT